MHKRAVWAGQSRLGTRMGQLVSSSSVVVEVTVGECGDRPFFVEYNGSYVPAVRPGVVYAVRLNRDGGEVVCMLQKDDSSVEIPLQRTGAPDRYGFRLDTPCASGFYRLKCLDVDAVVFVSGAEGSRAAEHISGSHRLRHGSAWLPDGAEFRKLIGGLEDSVASLQKSARWRILLDNLVRLNDLLRAVSSVCDGLLSIRVSFAGDEDHPLKRLFNEDLHAWIRAFNANHVLNVSQSLSKDVITPLQEFLEFEKQNQKILPKKQKNFHEAMRLMYSTQSSLPLSSKVQYELARLEYQNFLDQCFVVGPPLRRLYSGVSLFLRKRVPEKELNESYMKKNHQLRLSIKNARSLSDLTKLYSSLNTPHVETYAWVEFQEGDSTSAPGSTGSSSGSQWRQWIILDGNQLSVFHHSKKIPLHTVDLSFACIKKINRTTVEIQTSGLPFSVPASASSSSSVEHTSSNSKNHRSKVYLLFKDHSEAEQWFDMLKQVNLETKQYSSSAVEASSKHKDHTATTASLIDVVMSQHESNSRCCDCGDSQTVEWISINLLCVLCIKCSGVHRSMGSHVSKVRSLTLDSFTSPEILHLLRNDVSNANVNSIYESSDPEEAKLTPQSSDSERSRYIINKYQACKMVSDGNQDAKTSLKSLIKAIHLDSIYLLQKTIAQSKYSLRDIVTEQSRSDCDVVLPTIFQYSLKHHEMVHGKPVFFITEFLLYNGLPVDRIPNNTSNWSPAVIEYWKSKFDMYGVFSPNTHTSKPPEGRESTLAPLSIPADKQPGRRWSLNHMPSSPQIKSPTNILNMHKSLKLSKRGNGTRKS
ncbi:hypothetical protein HG536_0B00400 [Torulaspora globosa]|uniref:ADP-ribosylation factor GTPase-activating protein n=1 Tax=Torulaspora globosa TaxID=48254 RepID=A0A7G3ZCE3_9SACH|nr:uncharacterized protein HG536_0B00400 [Torulaspora globosa]QLL31179.1 hypothetical protein HG536_0B00400 [Torulaspora globosa]